MFRLTDLHEYRQNGLMTTASQPTSAQSQVDYWRQDCARIEPHGPHPTTIATCDHEHDKWCYGILDPESIAAAVDDLQPGQRVRATFEFVVAEPTSYPVDEARRPAVSGGGPDGHVVLRYTGSHPATALREKDPHVEGKVHPSLVVVEVIPDDT